MPNAMRIDHVLPQLPIVTRRTVVGGYASSVVNLAHRQSALGHDVRIISRLPRRYHYDGPITIVKVGELNGRSHRSPIEFVLATARHVHDCKDRIDIFHFHSGYVEYLGASIAARLASHGSRIAHTIYCPPQAELRGKHQRVLLAVASKLGIRLSGMSNHVSGRLGSNVRRTPPVIDTDYLSARTGQVPGAPRLLFVGNAMPEKGLVDLLDAYAILALETSMNGSVPSLTVTTELARTNSHETVAPAVARLERLNLASNITWLSIVPDMKELMQNHHIHVAPFRSTNGPSDYYVSTLEAMSMGMTCVVSDLPGMSEVVEDGINGYSHRAADSASLARTLSRALSHLPDTSVHQAARNTIVRMSANAPSDTFKLYEKGTI